MTILINDILNGFNIDEKSFKLILDKFDNNISKILEKYNSNLKFGEIIITNPASYFDELFSVLEKNGYQYNQCI